MGVFPLSALVIAVEIEIVVAASGRTAQAVLIPAGLGAEAVASIHGKTFIAALAHG